MDIAEFKKYLETPINGLLKGLGNELKQVAKNRLLEYQTNEFKRNYFTKTLLHRSEPVKLSDFYLPLHIHKYQSERRGSQSEKRISTGDIGKVFKSTKYITLIGSAGSGKSTIVKYLFLNSVETSFKIPIKIELRYLNDYKNSITEYIFDEIFLFYKLGFSKEIIDRLLNNGAFVFFLMDTMKLILQKKNKQQMISTNSLIGIPKIIFFLHQDHIQISTLSHCLKII